MLFDVLSMCSDNREQAHSYQRGAADLLRVGLGGALASIALEIVDYLRAPAASGSPRAMRKFALDGAVIAVYLLDFCARQTRAGDVAPGAARAGALPVGLSLTGLGFLALSANLRDA